MNSWRILEGDCSDVLATLEAGSVHTVVTSPPYFGLRDYGTSEWDGGDQACGHQKPTRHQKQGQTSQRKGRTNAEMQRNENFESVCGLCGARRVDRQIGLEPTPDEFVAALVEVFREVRRVLRDDGTVWLNLGDSYNAGTSAARVNPNEKWNAEFSGRTSSTRRNNIAALKPKDLLGIPWMVAFALRADGWYLRSEIIWHKPNPMPESVTDRPTKAHEQVFLLSKLPRYFYDGDAIREPHTTADTDKRLRVSPEEYEAAKVGSFHDHSADLEQGWMQAKVNGFDRLGNPAGRNKRSVWTVATQPFAGAHFATFPPKLIEPCILAGCPEGGMVLDPFSGAGTTGMVALRNNRSYIGIELNPEYAEMSRNRIRDDAPLLNTFAETETDLEQVREDIAALSRLALVPAPSRPEESSDTSTDVQTGRDPGERPMPD